MADIKFQCPECRQKIAVDGSAGGLQVDCPNCRSTLTIPMTSDENAGMVVPGTPFEMVRKSASSEPISATGVAHDKGE